jgi:hypothetical protein
VYINDWSVFAAINHLIAAGTLVMQLFDIIEHCNRSVDDEIISAIE